LDEVAKVGSYGLAGAFARYCVERPKFWEAAKGMLPPAAKPEAPERVAPGSLATIPTTRVPPAGVTAPGAISIAPTPEAVPQATDSVPLNDHSSTRTA